MTGQGNSKKKLRQVGENGYLSHQRESFLSNTISEPVFEENIAVGTRTKCKPYPTPLRKKKNHKDNSICKQQLVFLPFHKSHSFVPREHGNHHTLQ